jgi:predicted DNA binding CopG/RHH family protein
MKKPSKPTKPKKLKQLPKFASEDEEREFWSAHDSTDYVDWSRATRAEFPNLKPSTTMISIRLPQKLLNELKTLAKTRDVAYQALMKMYLADRVDEDMGRGRHKKRKTG